MVMTPAILCREVVPGVVLCEKRTSPAQERPFRTESAGGDLETKNALANLTKALGQPGDAEPGLAFHDARAALRRTRWTGRTMPSGRIFRAAVATRVQVRVGAQSVRTNETAADRLVQIQGRFLGWSG